MNTPNRFTDEQVIAYITGELSTEEHTTLESTLKTDPVLEQRVETYRLLLDDVKSWSQSEPFENSDLSSIPIPLMPMAAKPRTYWGVFSKAAIFIIGFGLGLLVQREYFINKPTSPSDTPSIESNGAHSDSIQSTAEPKNDRSQNTGHSSITAAPQVKRSYDQDGKLVIETTLKNSNSRAVWVVDGAFQPQTAITDEGEKQ